MPPVISIILMVIITTLLNIVSMLKFLTKLNIIGIANITPIINNFHPLLNLDKRMKFMLLRH